MFPRPNSSGKDLHPMEHEQVMVNRLGPLAGMWEFPLHSAPACSTSKGEYKRALGPKSERVEGGAFMKITVITLQICGMGVLLFSSAVLAQDADKQKLIEIEKVFAATATPGPESAAVAKQYFYYGPLVQLTGTGRIGTLPKARIVELVSKPDPSDPDVKTSGSISNIGVEFYGDTALVSYKYDNTDTGHKDAALNATDHYGCLDTFVKQKGQWLLAGSACARVGPIPQAEWAALKKARMQEPKDVQQAYH